MIVTGKGRLAQSKGSDEKDGGDSGLPSRSFSMGDRIPGLLCAGPHCLAHVRRRRL